jgi:hypothetical protein
MQDEADACADDPFPGHELWSLQEDGDIRMSLDARLPVHNAAFDHLPPQRAKPATKREMTQFHSDDYIEFLYKVTPNNMNNYQKEQAKCTVPF